MLEEPNNTTPEGKSCTVFLNCFLRKERPISAELFSNTITFSDINLTSKIFYLIFVPICNEGPVAVVKSKA